jgi:hypothetical protein
MPHEVRLLRTRGLRPRSRRAAGKSYELTPLHVALLERPLIRPAAYRGTGRLDTSKIGANGTVPARRPCPLWVISGHRSTRCHTRPSPSSKSTMCDRGHFAAHLSAVLFDMFKRMKTLQEASMARAAKKTGTRVARWLGALLQRKYYDTFE